MVDGEDPELVADPLAQAIQADDVRRAAGWQEPHKRVPQALVWQMRKGKRNK